MSSAGTTKRAAKYELRLRTLAEVLAIENLSKQGLDGLDAREIARRVGCSKPTVYAHIDALSERGFVISEKSKRVGERGPEATLYAVTFSPPQQTEGNLST